jgi:hypothetical protein
MAVISFCQLCFRLNPIKIKIKISSLSSPENPVRSLLDHLNPMLMSSNTGKSGLPKKKKGSWTSSLNLVNAPPIHVSFMVWLIKCVYYLYLCIGIVLQVLTNLTSAMRRFAALQMLPRSPLMPDILRPSPQASCSVNTVSYNEVGQSSVYTNNYKEKRSIVACSGQHFPEWGGCKDGCVL